MTPLLRVDHVLLRLQFHFIFIIVKTHSENLRCCWCWESFWKSYASFLGNNALVSFGHEGNKDYGPDRSIAVLTRGLDIYYKNAIARTKINPHNFSDTDLFQRHLFVEPLLLQFISEWLWHCSLMIEDTGMTCVTDPKIILCEFLGEMHTIRFCTVHIIIFLTNYSLHIHYLEF